MGLFDEILKVRGLVGNERDAFLNPSYDKKHDPFLLPDMQKAVDRLILARQKNEKITIYGDYDIDGLTATTLLLDAFDSLGYGSVDAFIPSRFVEGYGMTIDAVERIAEAGSSLIVTVDCGSLSEKEIIRAGELGVDVIVTDHHNVAAKQPPAVAVINPKRNDHEYPFIDLAGVGVAFKLVQALQTSMQGLDNGQEKWLLDLVALGTVCDVVSLTDENRANVYWGLKVMQKTRRPGIRALMAVAGVEPKQVTSRTLGFALGPRLNASGRLETAQVSLDLLTSKNGNEALEKARRLDDLNRARRAEQDEILKAAIEQAGKYIDDAVLVLAGEGWNHGVVGIVAAKIMEKFKKPTFVIGIEGEEAKGSARSYGDFSAADAIRFSEKAITKGGGHKLAAGVSLPTKNIDSFRKLVNQYYKEQRIENQEVYLLTKEDAIASIDEVGEELVRKISAMEPFGNGNPEPVLKTSGLRVTSVRTMGVEGQHVKLELMGKSGTRIQMLAFGAPDHFFVDKDAVITAWYQPVINAWKGVSSVEGRLLRVECE